MAHGGPPGGHVPPPEHHAPPQLGHSGPGGHDSHESSNIASGVSSINGTTVKIFSEADPDFNLAVKGDEVVVLKANDSDPNQLWIKDETYSNQAQDSAGYPGFSLINKGTGKALKHPSKVEDKVLLADYQANSSLNEVQRTLWSLGKDEGHGYHAIRSLSNIGLNLDIDHGSKKYGGIKDGQAVIVFTWKDEKNQHWKITEISAETTTSNDHHHLHLPHGH